MIIKLLLGTTFVLGLVTTAQAAVTIAPQGMGPMLTRVAEGCGKGMWRGPHGHCHPFEGPGGTDRGTEFACPPGFHIGKVHDRCFHD